MLRATAACHFSPVCQNSYLRTRRFSEATFRTSATTNHWKNTAIRDFTNIFRACWTPCYWLCTPVDLLAPDSTHMLIFLLLTWLLCDSSLQLYILSEVRLLNFLRQQMLQYSLPRLSIKWTSVTLMVPDHETSTNLSCSILVSQHDWRCSSKPCCDMFGGNSLLIYTFHCCWEMIHPKVWTLTIPNEAFRKWRWGEIPQRKHPYQTWPILIPCVWQIGILTNINSPKWLEIELKKGWTISKWY